MCTHDKLVHDGIVCAGTADEAFLYECSNCGACLTARVYKKAPPEWEENETVGF